MGVFLNAFTYMGTGKVKTGYYLAQSFAGGGLSSLAGAGAYKTLAKKWVFSLVADTKKYIFGSVTNDKFVG